MAYEKTEWKGRKGTNLSRHKKEQETAQSVILHNVPTQVTQPGTPFSVANMNKIEQGIYDAHEGLAAETEARQAAIKTHDNSIVAHPEIRQKITEESNARQGQIDGLNEKIPAQASESNQLADKNFVNSSISGMASNYVTPNADGDTQWPSLEALRVGPWYHGGTPYAPSQNDYAIYIEADGTTWRAAFNGNLWSPTFKINDTPFTAAQLAAINSNITAELVQKILSNEAGISNLHAALDNAVQNLQNQINVLDPESMIDELAKLAPLNSPVFTGTPKVPNKSSAAASDGTLIATEAQVALKANIASPAFTGTPSAPVIATIPLVKNANTETLNDWGNQIVSMNTLRNAIIKNVWPTGAYYVQFPVTGQSTYANMFPSSEAPATLFGGTWTAQYEAEDVYFRTGSTIDTTSDYRRGRQWNDSTKAWETGTTGIEEDAARNAEGAFNPGTPSYSNAGFMGSSSGVFSMANSRSARALSASAGNETVYDAKFSLTGIIPTANRNRVKNRLIKVWKKTA